MFRKLEATFHDSEGTLRKSEATFHTSEGTFHLSDAMFHKPEATLLLSDRASHPFYGTLLPDDATLLPIHGTLLLIHGTLLLIHGTLLPGKGLTLFREELFLAQNDTIHSKPASLLPFYPATLRGGGSLLLAFRLDTAGWAGLDETTSNVQLLTIPTLKTRALEGRVEGCIHGQVDTLNRKETRDGKPFWEVILADAEGRLTLRAWSDSPAFSHCEEMRTGDFIEVCGEFAHSSGFGVDAKRWTCRELNVEERDALLAGPPELRARQAADYEFISREVAQVADPRLRALGMLYLSEHGDRFRRTAAARFNHHARRGGLVEHVAQMMRLAVAISGVYPYLNRDLLVLGVLFHDSGKLWENALPADGFGMPYYDAGEMLGHITIGIELVNTLWRRLLASKEAQGWSSLQPPNEEVRLHLLHLLASHHGELQFGSPVVPKTPEAWTLHHIDNMDAKLEMMAQGYPQAKQLAPRIFEKVRPLPGNLVMPLRKFTAAEDGTSLVSEDGVSPANGTHKSHESHESHGSNGNGHSVELLNGNGRSVKLNHR